MKKLNVINLNVVLDYFNINRYSHYPPRLTIPFEIVPKEL